MTDTVPEELPSLDDSTTFDTPADLGTDFSMFDTTPIDTVPLGAATKGSGTEAALPSANISKFEDGSAGKAAVLVGTLALMGALALSFGDRLMGRRTRRRIP